MGSSNASLIMTLVNSIIGVSILAMPFCYKQCGILLASLILIFSNLMTRLSCHYLLKSAIMTRRRTFELLAFHALGPAGKTLVEISIILLMIGTCIAFFVVMGDLSPPIIGSILQLKMTTALRPAVILGLAVFVVLPLGLLRNVDSLSSICTASFLFYLFLVFKVFIECTTNLFSGSWIDEVYFWRPAGILQCLPIFSMALSCQTQLLEVFDSAPNGTLDRMNLIVKSAVNLCTALYISVGFFGYIGFYKQPFSGNLLTSFSESYFSEFIKLGFVLSVAVTFPLVIFPCRASLHSLLFKKAHVPHYELVTGGGNHIPEGQFKCITFFIITVSLIVGLLAPNIEIVLGLLGSTIGVIICFLCPPILFICISSKATTEKVLAQFLCALGLFIMVMGTYANLYLSEHGNDIELQNWKQVEPSVLKVPLDAQLKEIPPKIEPSIEIKNIRVEDSAKKSKSPIKAQESVVAKKLNFPGDVSEENKRVEPPIPEAPPKSKNGAEQNDVKDNAESNRVEPPAPIAPLANNDKDSAPGAVLKDENQGVKPSGLANPPADSKAAAGESLSSKLVDPMSLSKDVGKPDAGDDAENVKPAPLKAQKSPSNGEQRLLNEQKEILQKMRGAKKQNAKLPAMSAKDKNVDTKELHHLEKITSEPILGEVKKINDVAPLVKSAGLQETKKLPLPLLVHSNAKGESGSPAGEPPKREILENVDREKRDLYYANKSQPISGETEAEASSKLDAEVKSVDVEPQKDVNIAERNDSPIDENPTCEKDSKGKAASAMLKEVVPEKKFSGDKPKASDSTSTEVKELINSKEKEYVGLNKDDNLHEEFLSRSIEPMSAVNTAVDKKSDGFVIAPSKLSDPIMRLPESVPIDDKFKAALLDVVKPMSRELKMVQDKPETNNKKK